MPLGSGAARDENGHAERRKLADFWCQEPEGETELDLQAPHTVAPHLWEHAGKRVGKADINLPVKVRSGQSRADRPGASLAGVAATRGLKRRQQVHGVYGSNPEMCLSWRPSWNSPQRRRHGCSRYARG